MLHSTPSICLSSAKDTMTFWYAPCLTLSLHYVFAPAAIYHMDLSTTFQASIAKSRASIPVHTSILTRVRLHYRMWIRTKASQHFESNGYKSELIGTVLLTLRCTTPRREC
jgi:hypothetical protein